jgi:peptidoglycan/xylan/chitin deacetylase (PgdA/CDA1 family)
MLGELAMVPPSCTLDELSTFESRLIRLAGTLLSRTGCAASLLVMLQHRVLPKPDPLLPGEPDATFFASQIELITRHFNVLPLREALGRLRDGTLPARTVCITFDDGYADNCTVAAPILASRGVPATMFIATGYLNGGRMFNDTVLEALRRAPAGDLDLQALGLPCFELEDDAGRFRAASDIIASLKYLAPEERARRANAVAEHIGAPLPDDLMMNDAQVEQLAGMGFEIGAHTVNHPILTSVDEAIAWSEIERSRQLLEEITGAPVRSFAYPNGRPRKDYARGHVDLVRKAGFDVAVSTAWGAATAKSDELQIPRIAPWDASARRYAARMLRAYRQRGFLVA